jgi:hypothetical protein
MIGGQMFFSLLVLDSLHRLGVHLSEEGAAAYFYAWRVVGAMPGVDEEAVPGALPEARQFLDLYMTRHMGPSTEGAHLTPQLIDLYEDVVPGTLFDPVVSALIRYLVGDTCADWLQVPAPPGTPACGRSPTSWASWSRSRTAHRWPAGPWTAWAISPPSWSCPP